MNDLTTFRDHARRMSTARHTDECGTWTNPKRLNAPRRWQSPNPACAGCVTPAQRDLWARLADEVDAYLNRHPEEMTLL